MKKLINKLVALYASNGKFHSLVVAIEFAVVAFFGSYTGGIPTTKQGWIALASGFGGFFWGALKGWLRNNVSLPTPSSNTTAAAGLQ